MTEPRPPSPPAVMLFRAAPVILAVLFAGSVATLLLLSWRGGTATGARVAVTLMGECPVDSWQHHVADRARAIGLGEPEVRSDGAAVTVTATLPGLPDDRKAIPALLARRGTLEMRLDDKALASHDDLVGASPSVDEAGQPYARLTFTPEAAARIAETGDGHDMTTLVDGEPRGVWLSRDTLQTQTVRLLEGGADNRERMRRAADDAIVLSHGPLPCAVRVDSIVDVPR
jgi:hypothetical protein